MDRALCVAPARSWRTDFALERGFLAISCDRRKYASDVRDAGDVILFAARPVPRGHGACKSYAVLRARRRARATRCLRRSSSPCERGEQGAAPVRHKCGISAASVQSEWYSFALFLLSKGSPIAQQTLTF